MASVASEGLQTNLQYVEFQLIKSVKFNLVVLKSDFGSIFANIFHFHEVLFLTLPHPLKKVVNCHIPPQR